VLRIDELALDCARRLAAAQPRCDYTIEQLPAATSLETTDLFVIFRTVGSGSDQTYQIAASLLAALINGQSGTQASVPMDGSATVAVTFPTQFAAAPVVTLTVQDATGSAMIAKLSGAPTTTGFVILGLLGPAGSTATVHWSAQVNGA
jgi:hypothetical protein